MNFHHRLRHPTHVAFAFVTLLLFGVPAVVQLAAVEKDTINALAYAALCVSVLPILIAVPEKWPARIEQLLANRIVDSVVGKIGIMGFLFLGFILMGMAR